MPASNFERCRIRQVFNGVRQNLDTAIKNMNDTAGQPCSEKVIDYVTAQWRLISIRKNIDAAFTNFDLVALPTMRITPRTINDSLNREEEPKPREPEVISNCTLFNIFGLPRHLDPMWFFERRTSDRIDDCRSAVLRRKSARARKCV